MRRAVGIGSKRTRLRGSTTVIIFSSVTLAPALLLADVIRDGSIGPDRAIQPPGPNFAISETLGERRGGNVFHSFSEFSLSARQSATFSATADTANIIARVTGPHATLVDGLLRVLPGADFYLLNPHGIAFGVNAKLDIPGAFFASTADRLEFFNGDAFSALPDGNAPILSTAAPAQFGFLGSDAAPIELHGAHLVSAYDVTLHAADIVLDDGARITTSTDRSQGGADITLSAANRISLSGVDGEGIAAGLDTGTRDAKHAGDARLTARAVDLRDGAWIATATSASGNAGSVDVRATERVTLAGQTRGGNPTQLRADAAALGHAGEIRLHAPIIELLNGAQLSVSTTGAGNGGEALLDATERITLAGSEPAAIRADSEAQGKAGYIRLSAPLIDLRDAAQIHANARGAGGGGVVSLDASERVRLSGVSVEGLGSSLQANTEGRGDGGVVRVASPQVMLQDGAYVQANAGARSQGHGGTVQIAASEQLTLAGHDGNATSSSLQAKANGEGAAGTLAVSAAVIELRDGAFISASAARSAVANPSEAPDEPASAPHPVSVHVTAQQRVSLSGTGVHGEGSHIETTALERGDGRGIRITAPLITLSDGAFISSNSAGTGNAGSIEIAADNRLQLTGGSAISTSVRNSAAAGGDITIRAPLVVLQNSQLLAQAHTGSGGDIQISANNVVTSQGSMIDASADGGSGIDGEVISRFPKSELSRELARPSIAFLDAAAQLRPSCETRAARGDISHFRVVQQNGLPLSPEDLLPAFDTDSVALTEDNPASSRVLRGLAQIQQTEGRYEASLQTLQAALAQSAAAQDEPGIAATLGQFGNVYLGLGEIQRAEHLMREAIARAADDAHRSLAALFNNLGNLYWLQHQYPAALDAYHTSAQQARQAGDPAQQVKALANAARAALAAGNTDAALALFNEARNIVPPLSNDSAKSAMWIHLAKSAEQLSAASPGLRRLLFSAAYQDLRQAANLSRERNDARNLSYALGNLGGLYQQEQRRTEALYLTYLALHAAEQANAAESLYRWHWQAGQLLWLQGDVEAALSNYRRAVTILDGSRPEALAQYGDAQRRFRQLVAPVYMDLVDALLQRAAYAADSEAQALLKEAQLTMERLKAAELRDYFRDECVAELDAKRTRLDAISATAAVIYPISLPTRLELLVSLPSGLQRYTVAADAATVDAAIRHLRNLVETQAPGCQARAAARLLYQWFVEPYVADLARVDTLVFVPGGSLRTLPLAALYDGEDYLIRRYRVVVTPGLALTDPRPFDRDDVQVVLAGVSEPVENFPALPAVPGELAAVQRLYGGRLLLDKDFTLRALTQALMQPVSVIHIASHAQFTGDPESSFLLAHDGRLSMRRLEETLNVTRFRERPLELLVLSACQTAASDERAALGLAGVGVRAGARSALGSLWAVDDQASAALVTAFYRHLKQPGVSRAAALQRAQQEMLNDGRFNDPFFWSGFLLINNWL